MIEYKVEWLSPINAETRLNVLAAEGWRVVAALAGVGGGWPPGSVGFVLERERKEE